MKTGLVISGVATAVIAAMDLFLGDNTSVNLQFENDLALFAMFFLVSWTIGHYAKLEENHIKEVVDFANLDGLTGTYNHRYFYEVLGKLFEESRRDEKPLSLVMLDLDNF
jgi:predicted signal transduction protein with EAL and GGDEF domain